MRLLLRYWGYLLLAVAVFGVVKGLALDVTAIMSAVAFGYFVFWAPVWCAAVNRDGTFCRNNSAGLLLGCRFRQHKWQKLKAMFYRGRWKALNAGLWISPSARLATVASLIAVGTPLSGLALHLIRS